MEFEVFNIQQNQVDEFEVSKMFKEFEVSKMFNEFEVSKMFNEFEVSLNVQLKHQLPVHMKLPSTGRRQTSSEPLGVRRSSNGRFVVYWST